MLKFSEYAIVTQEFPDEVTIAFNISNCPCNCQGCHSSYLAEDIGSELTYKVIEEIFNKNSLVTCIGLMGGDSNPKEVLNLARKIKNNLRLKVGWYSGKDALVKNLDLSSLDYYKIGHYDLEKGPLDSKTTNQILYRLAKYKESSSENCCLINEGLLFDIPDVLGGMLFKNITFRFHK